MVGYSLRVMGGPLQIIGFPPPLDRTHNTIIVQPKIPVQQVFHGFSSLADSLQINVHARILNSNRI